MSERTLNEELAHILRQIRQDRFGGRDAPFVELRPATGVGADGSMYGAFEVRITRRSGEAALLHEQSLDGITTVSGLNDTFSEALSRVLAEHSAWPR